MSERAMHGAIYPYHDVWPTIAESAYIAPGAIIIGDVTIGEECVILSGAVLRGDNTTIVVERGANVQENAMVHVDPDAPARIGAYCVIGHNAIIHGSTIGPSSLVGMHATVLNHSEIGAGSIIGAAALIAEGTVVPPQTMMLGVPAKPRRAVSDEEVAGIRRSAEGYVRLSREYLASGMGRVRDVLHAAQRNV
ncbi:MAG: gamma carbonic anhydrase family protein [Chloroflexota bacterium]|nr:gamma carbonic anhydrase family protein [Chloroflexota bacterium]